MLGVKNRVCIALCLCSALLACDRENTKMPVKRDSTRIERIDDPVLLLRALDTAKGPNRALVLEKLRLTKEAIYAWNETARQNPQRPDEARRHIDALQKLSHSVKPWNSDEIDRALERRNEAELTKIVHAFPADAAQYFERYVLRDRERARLFAKVLAGAGEHYPQAVIDAMDRTTDRVALDRGLDAFRKGDFQRAAMLFERAGNPLSLAAYYYAAAGQFSRALLDTAIPRLKPEYRELSFRIYTFHAYLLESADQYLEAHADYKRARAVANGEATLTAAILGREGFNFATIGNAEEAFRDAHRALNLLPSVANLDARNHAYAGAAKAAAQLGHPNTALLYQSAAVEDAQRAVIAAPASQAAKLELSVAFRQRAEFHVQLEQGTEARDDLQQAADLAEAAQRTDRRDLMRMRRLEVEGQSLLKSDPTSAVRVFSEAIELAKSQDSTYRAVLHFERGAARRKAKDPRADEDDAAAIEILRNEVRNALTINPQAVTELLWTPYFSRFRDWQDELIESRILEGDIEGALVYDELARAFEPMQILLQSRSPEFRFIQTRADLQEARAGLPEDTVILQYLVLPKRTFTWVITRERLEIIQQRATKAEVQRWITKNYMRAAYAELFDAPLKRAGSTKTRIVIVPDESMQGLAFNSLETAKERYLIERASIAVDSSTSLYLYALARDRQLSADRNPTPLLVANPAFEGYDPIPHAEEEVAELSRNYYPGAAMLVGPAATVQGFLAGAKSATIIHFAGHAVSASENPWQSRLLLAPHGQESGELTAQRLLQKLPELRRTRLVVLSACSTFGGGSAGDHGLTPLARPFTAANVPAVVGSLWDVNDASTKDLLVFFHCHYRHGDDVAVALRNAQLAMLRKKDTVGAWKAFQVVGFAASPYPRSAALEEPSSEHVCTQNSLLGPDGLHSQ
jgi:CHAT domain-containing protein